MIKKKENRKKKEDLGRDLLIIHLSCRSVLRVPRCGGEWRFQQGIGFQGASYVAGHRDVEKTVRGSFACLDQPATSSI